MYLLFQDKRAAKERMVVSSISQARKEVMEKWQSSKTFDWQKSIKELDLYLERKTKGYNICNGMNCHG